jgi:SMODS-associated and fused to various effectors sensor domain
MSVTNVPEKVRTRLWGKAAGRCQYEGCNKPLWIDGLTKAEFNISYIAHIIADVPGGPRGDAILSEQLRADISNLMLMCDEHHRLIDKTDIAGHPVGRLKAMKESHEKRIELLSSIMNDKRSHVLLYGAKIGEQHAPLSLEKAAVAMVPAFFPADFRPIELSLKNSSFADHEDDYWRIEQTHLIRQFDDLVRARLAMSEIKRFSVFAFAPIPLLVKLGALLSDIPEAEVYQLHREPPDWVWQADFDNEFIRERPAKANGVPALVLSLSATIVDERIFSVLKDEHSIWKLTLTNPGNDFMKSREQLSVFRKVFRELLDEIKALHGQSTCIHIFPAVPVSVAVEIGRVWSPKADVPLVVYDQNRKAGGFTPALTIGEV